MTKNPILDELHAVRQRLLADADGTLDGLINRLQAEEQKSNRPRFKPRRPVQSTPATQPDESARENPKPPPGER